MELDWITIISIVLAWMASLGSGTTFYIKLIQERRKIKGLDDVLAVVEKGRTLIVDIESKPNLTSNEKFVIVLSRLGLFCREKDIKITESKLKEIIQGIIDGHNAVLTASGNKHLTMSSSESA